LSHVLAQAIQRTLDPAVQLGTGPAIDDGFYYDVSLSQGVEFKEENLKELGKVMEGIVKEWQGFGKYTAKDKAEALMICDLMNQTFKKELIEKFYQADNTAQYTFYYNFVDSKSLPALEKKSHSDYITLYQKLTDTIAGLDSSLSGNFITFLDLCEGGHVENLKEIPDGCFSMNKIAGAYWQGKEGNPMMTRIYGRAFPTKDELKTHLALIEEAKRRDHRIIGAKMKLFTISELVGAGMPLFQPNGMIIRKELEDYLRSMHKDKGYQRVWTPHLAKEDLYVTSGHAEKFGDELFRVSGKEDSFFMKPMNCPHHMQIYADNAFSYRDMPIRYFEPATVYRDEKTGQLSGLTRVRTITQDDGHLFCRIGQISEEVGTIVDIIKQFYTTMGMIEGYRVRLSIRGPEGKYLGSDEVWEKAEKALQDASEKYDLPYRVGIDEAAFYGPKLDFMFKDALGRERQLATIQCDFNLPERFDLSFVNEQGEKERPVVIHRAISGSLERFMWVMIEHFAGDFPLWLSPEQIRVVPVAEVFTDYAKEVQQLCNEAGLRAKVDTSDDSFSKKIRNAETDKVYYVLIVGEKETQDTTVSLRNVRTKEQEVLGLEEFVEKAFDLYNNRGL
jgi:threonyl-tRNA synthetase